MRFKQSLPSSPLPPRTAFNLLYPHSTLNKFLLELGIWNAVQALTPSSSLFASYFCIKVYSTALQRSKRESNIELELELELESEQKKEFLIETNKKTCDVQLFFA